MLQARVLLQTACVQSCVHARLHGSIAMCEPVVGSTHHRTIVPTTAAPLPPRTALPYLLLIRLLLLTHLLLHRPLARPQFDMVMDLNAGSGAADLVQKQGLGWHVTLAEVRGRSVRLQAAPSVPSGCRLWWIDAETRWARAVPTHQAALAAYPSYD